MKVAVASGCNAPQPRGIAPSNIYSIPSKMPTDPKGPLQLAGSLQAVAMGTNVPEPVVQNYPDQERSAYEGRHFARQFYADQLSAIQQGVPMVGPVPKICYPYTYGGYWGKRQDLQNQFCGSRKWGFDDTAYFAGTAPPEVVRAMSQSSVGNTLLRMG